MLQIAGCLRRFLAATEALRDAEREQRRDQRILAAQKKKGKKKGGKKKGASVGPLVHSLSVMDMNFAELLSRLIQAQIPCYACKAAPT